MGRDAYVEVRADQEGAWRYTRRAGNHRLAEQSHGYERRSAATRAAQVAYPDLEIRVYDRDGAFDRVVLPEV